MIQNKKLGQKKKIPWRQPDKEFKCFRFTNKKPTKNLKILKSNKNNSSNQSKKKFKTTKITYMSFISFEFFEVSNILGLKSKVQNCSILNENPNQ